MRRTIIHRIRNNTFPKLWSQNISQLMAIISAVYARLPLFSCPNNLLEQVLKKSRHLIVFTVFLYVIAPTNHSWAQNQDKVKVESVEFEGNQAFSDDRLQMVMVTKPSWFFSTVYYYPEIFRDDIKNLRLFYEQHGYLDAEIEETTVNIDSIKNVAHIRITIDEGQLTRVEGVSVFGNSVFSDQELLKIINLEEHDPFMKQRVKDAKLAILTRYANHGYLEADVTTDIRINKEANRAIIDFIIKEKIQYLIGQIYTKGLEKTNKNVVMRELLFHPGDVVHYSELLESQRRLYMTGLFQSVYIRPEPSDTGDSTKKDIQIELKEKVYGEFNVSVGYGSIDRLRGQIEIYNTNFLGTARQVGFSAKASFINRGIEASYTQPWTFGYRWRTDVTAKLDYMDQPGFDVIVTGGRIVFGRDFFDRSKVNFRYRYENSDFTNVKTTPIPEKLKTNIRSFTVSLIYDTRDDLFNPKEGTYLQWNTEMAGSFLAGTNTFARSVWTGKYFYPYSRSTVIGTALEVGWMDLFGGSREIPLNERFYTGGPNSLRGFNYQEVGPLDKKGVPLGGKLKVEWNVFEIRRTIYKMIGGVLFADCGNVWSEPEYFNPKDLRYNVGAGLRANTPIGIVRFDAAFNPTPIKDEPRWKFYFNMGQAF